MLTIATNAGTFQWHRYEHVRIRRNGKSETRQVKDWLYEDNSTGFKFSSGDEVNAPKHGWLTILSASWNTAYDREQEAERARRKAEREEELKRQQEREAEERRQIAAGMSAML